MIYEVRTYDLKPHSLPEVEKRFGEAYEKRKKLSEMYAFWHTEVGPLNQIIHVWPYKDLEERARIRAQAIAEKVWPPATGEFLVNQRTDIFVAANFMPKIAPGKYGPWFEMRTYTANEGKLPTLETRFRDHTIRIFNKYSMTSIGYWIPEDGPTSQTTLVYILAHPSREAAKANWAKFQSDPEWQKVRKESIERGGQVVQDSSITLLRAAAFSPIR